MGLAPSRRDLVHRLHGPEGGVYTFVTGIERALERAKAAAGEKNVTVMARRIRGRTPAPPEQ